MGRVTGTRPMLGAVFGATTGEQDWARKLLHCSMRRCWC